MNRIHRPTFISGAAAVSAFGFEWRGLGRALKGGHIGFSSSMQLADSHPGIFASEVSTIPGSIDAGGVKTQKLMSRPARLGAIAVQQVLADSLWNERREEIGFYFGVGASGGSMVELTEMLRASIVDRQFSLARFGSAGLAACNPLFAFQLMNNFTLCHGAILNGVGGPNSAFYSRGNGTVAALFEAMHAIADGDCERALAGGADSAVHEVTWAELEREGYAKQGLIPGEGAALLALSSSDNKALAIVEHCVFQNSIEALSMDLDAASIDFIIIAPWGQPARRVLRRIVETKFTRAAVLDISESLGDALAATPALGWVAALDLLQSKEAKRCLILNAGIDGGIGAVVLGQTPTSLEHRA
ncbi:MAG TPA: beta-ketoacyl synthase N-terminal-like domain-containing protein [Burkholderiales bacterium]|jgi:hypothetical protein|nr:beta-ketoacyl synthase N-terminal-like domain-containing protein [Burkholderiales bacterium]